MARQTRVLHLIAVAVAAAFAAKAAVAAAGDYQALAYGRLVHTGNSLSLSGQASANGPGTVGSGHTIVSLDPLAVDDAPANPGNPWFAGTTNDYVQGGSAGVLQLPERTSVLAAFLIWGGSYQYGAEDLSESLDLSVTLITPAGRVFAVTPEPLLSRTLELTSGTGIAIRFYLRAADVTARIAHAGGGAYRVGGVPLTQHELQNSLNGGGWALVLAVAGAELPCRTLAFEVVGEWIDEFVQFDAAIDSLDTPAAGGVAGRLVLGALEGDAASAGDAVAILDPGTLQPVLLAGPNNPLDNFFAAQINDGAGQLDTSGTFGNLNHVAAAGSNVAGGRQGWDLTALDLASTSGHLGNAQLASSVRFSSTGDGYVAAFVGLEADATGPCGALSGELFQDAFEAGDFEAWAWSTP